MRIEGRIFFANAEHIAQKVKALAEEANSSIIAVDMSAVPDLEYTALKKLVEVEEKQRNAGKRIWLVGMNDQVLRVVQRSQLGAVLGRNEMHFNLEGAVEKFLGATTAA